MKTILVFAVLILASQSVTLASGSDMVGNGGDGLEIGSKVYLLDLVEVGTHLNPVISNLEPQSGYAERIAGATQMTPEVSRIVSVKLTELSYFDRFLSAALLQAIEMHKWKFVTYGLENIGDEHSPINFGHFNVIQIAIRQSPIIYINKESFDRMNEANQAALVLHEAVYSVIKPINLNGIQFQASWLARQVVSSLFERDFSTFGSKIDPHLLELLPYLSQGSRCLEVKESAQGIISCVGGYVKGDSEFLTRLLKIDMESVAIECKRNETDHNNLNIDWNFPTINLNLDRLLNGNGYLNFSYDNNREASFYVSARIPMENCKEQVLKNLKTWGYQE